jgi:Autoinducer synthase
MIQLITPDRYGAFLGELAEMHRLRYRVFKQRLGWDVEVSGDMEFDEFDACLPAYLLQTDDQGRIQECVLLLPTTGPTMLPRYLPAVAGRTARAGVRYHLGEQPVRRRSLLTRREDGAQYRQSDVRAVRRHDRIRLDAPAHRHRHRDGCADGANSSAGRAGHCGVWARLGRSVRCSQSRAISKCLRNGSRASAKPAILRAE